MFLERTPKHDVICTLSAVLALGAVVGQPSSAYAQGAPISEQEAHAIAVDGYIYFYPLLSMDVSRKQFTNRTSDFKGPMNSFVNVREYPPATFKGVVRSNFDTLYSVSWLDMTKEPVVITAPDTDERYYLLPMLDMWTDVFASPGWRTTGTKAGTFLVTPPGWRPDLRDRFIDEFKLPKNTQRIEAPTPYVWLIGRTKTDGRRIMLRSTRSRTAIRSRFFPILVKRPGQSSSSSTQASI
jgi:hypothetical protein